MEEMNHGHEGAQVCMMKSSEVSLRCPLAHGSVTPGCVVLCTSMECPSSFLRPLSTASLDVVKPVFCGMSDERVPGPRLSHRCVD